MATASWCVAVAGLAGVGCRVTITGVTQDEPRRVIDEAARAQDAPLYLKTNMQAGHFDAALTGAVDAAARP